MVKNIVISVGSRVILCLLVLCCWCPRCRRCIPLDDDPASYNPFTVSSFRYPQTELEPYAWRYIRVDLPPWFSSMSIALDSDVDLDVESIGKLPMSRLPMICLRDGGPPLPDVSNLSIKNLVSYPLSSWTFGAMQSHQNLGQCYPMQKNISVKLTNEQISSGVWYFGIFNGIGPTRTQSKMITRGPAFSFIASIKVKKCMVSTRLGQYCNLTVEPLSCAPYYNNSLRRNPSDVQLYNESVKNMVYCANSLAKSCHEVGELKVYSLEIMGMVGRLMIMAKDVRFYEVPPLNKTVNASEFKFMCFARHGAIPLATLHDYSVNINDSPLVISSPKQGRWYIAFLPVKLSNDIGGADGPRIQVCYRMNWEVLECLDGTAGLNCMWGKYFLQAVLRRDTAAPFESYYLPESRKVYSDEANFLLEPLLSNLSSIGELHDAWTYFLLDVPRGAAGANLHIHLTSNARINYEIYVRFGGLPSVQNWDFFYANKTSYSSTVLGKLYNSSQETVDLYIFYIKEGTWSFGLRHLDFNDRTSKGRTALAISLERCPKRCSSHGSCRSVMDMSGLMVYSYCFCDRDHGGFDCSVEIVSHKGHVWQSVSLIASNAAAVLPALLTLRKKAFAEFVLFTSSGISSGLYHACDVGTWCVLNFHALQFMDFWLSFMAVVSTFVFLAVIDEASKRTIHTGVSILTALMAVTGPTRSGNIILVVAIGALGLLIGWMIEFTMKWRSLAFSTEFHFDLQAMWQNLWRRLHNLAKMLVRRFRWGFVVFGFIALAMAGISWNLESSASYWIWHSSWHVSIYTSSFCFLYSKVDLVGSEDQSSLARNYELTRQNSGSFP